MHRVLSLMMISALTWPAEVGAEPHAQRQRIDQYSVRATTPGDELLLTIDGDPPVVRLFLQADDATITVLNLQSTPLPRHPARALRDLASKDPAQFERFRSPGVEHQLADEDLRLSFEGLFAGPQKLADLSQLVETIPRDQLVAVKSAYHFPRGATVAIVITVAAAAGLLLLASICKGACIGR